MRGATPGLEARAGAMRVPWLAIIPLGAVLALAYTQLPLYSSNQNQYFFHGLVRAGLGSLRFDVLARTVDPMPVFSALVYLTHRLLDDRLFYAYYALILGVFAYSMLGIAATSAGVGSSRVRVLAMFALLVALGSPVLGRLSTDLIGFNLGWHLLSGVALQSVLGVVFQPSVFGTLLLLSVYLMLRGRTVWALAMVALAATVHPTYLLSAAVLALSYLGVVIRRGEGIGRALALGSLAGVLVLPICAYVYLNFRPTTPQAWQEAQTILTTVRGPWHTMPARWLGPLAYAKTALVVLAALLVRRTALAWIIVPALVVAVGLSALQILTGSTYLLMLFPWRLSVILVPLATAVVLGRVLTYALDAAERRLRVPPSVVAAASVLVAGLLAGVGTTEMMTRVRAPDRDGRAAMMAAARATAAPAHRFLIPLDFETFRLATGAVAYVDFNFIPYRDVEVLAWHQRIRRAVGVFDAAGAERCRRLDELARTEGVTHVILRRDELRGCEGWTVLLREKDYSLYAWRG
jgi:hypothetical protein